MTLRLPLTLTAPADIDPAGLPGNALVAIRNDASGVVVRHLLDPLAFPAGFVLVLSRAPEGFWTVMGPIPPADAQDGPSAFLRAVVTWPEGRADPSDPEKGR